jgi:hypothetical protein
MPRKDKKSAKSSSTPSRLNTTAPDASTPRVRVMMVNDLPSHTLTANDLRRLAEHADGCRGDLMEITGEQAGGKIRRIGSTSMAKPGSLLIQTPFKNPGRKLPKSVALTTQSDTPHTLDTGYFDSVFWGEAAMEKFLIPYYIRFSDDDVAKIREAIDSEDIIALAHVYPTFYEPFKDSVFVLSDGPSFTGIGFIPLSDWLSTR